MIVAFAPYQFTLIGTESCGRTSGEVHSVRVHTRSGAWATRRAGRTEVYHDLPVNLGRAESDLYARRVAEMADECRWAPVPADREATLTEACLRQGGICSVAQNTMGRLGPYPLPFARGFEQNISLYAMGDTAHLDHHYDRPSDAASLTVMAGMAVKAMAAQDWQGLGKVLDQAWRLRRDTIPQAVMNHYNRLMLSGAWGCAWVGPDVLLAVGAPDLGGDSYPLKKFAYQIDDEGARPRALIEVSEA